MDCQMPVMDGYEATLALRQWEKDTGSKRIPVIAMTANAMHEARDKCLAVGMDDYLTKPIRLQVLRDAIKRWAKNNEEAAVAHNPVQKGLRQDAQSGDTLNAQSLDGAILSEIKQALGEEALCSIIGLFEKSGRELLGALKQSLSAEDLKELGMTVHTLKGTSSNIGAVHLVRLCRDLGEIANRKHIDDNMSRLVDDIHSEFERVATELKKVS
jgi:HPt (histidine-containing phosphotransfer) domain-containing protein